MFADYPKLLVYGCSFQVNVREANLSLKFPCELFAEWKTASGKRSIVSKNRIKIKNSVALFNEDLNLESEMLFDQTADKFLKKQSLLLLNLISSSRPDSKLVGRVTIDLADVLSSSNPYQQFKNHTLNYCSVSGATINFNVTVTQKLLLEKDPREVDRDSFTDYFSFHSGRMGQSRQRSIDSHRQISPRNLLKSRTTVPRQVDHQRKFIRSSIVKKKEGADDQETDGKGILNPARKIGQVPGSRQINGGNRANNNNVLGDLGSGKGKEYTQSDRDRLREKIKERLPERKAQQARLQPAETQQADVAVLDPIHKKEQEKPKQGIAESIEPRSQQVPKDQPRKSHPHQQQSSNTVAQKPNPQSQKTPQPILKSPESQSQKGLEANQQVEAIRQSFKLKLEEQQNKRFTLEKQLATVRTSGDPGAQQLRQNIETLTIENQVLLLERSQNKTPQLIIRLAEEIEKKNELEVKLKQLESQPAPELSPVDNTELQELDRNVFQLKIEVENLTTIKNQAEQQLNSLRSVLQDYENLQDLFTQEKNNSEAKSLKLLEFAAETNDLKAQLQAAAISMAVAIQQIPEGKPQDWSSEKLKMEELLKAEQEKIYDLEIMLGELQNQLDAKVQENMDLKFELSEIKIQGDQTKSPQQTLPVAQCNHVPQISSLKQTIKSLESLLLVKQKQLETSKQTLEKQLSAFNNTPTSNIFPSVGISVIKEPTNESEELGFRIQELEKEKEALNSEVQSAIDSYSELESKFNLEKDQFQNERMAFNQQLLAAQVSDQPILKENKEKLEAMQREIDEMTIEKDTIVYEKDYLAAEMDKAISEKDAVVNQLQELQTQFAEIQAENQTLMDDKEILFAEKWNHEEEVDIQKEKMKMKESQIRGYEADIRNFKNIIAELNDKVCQAAEQKVSSEKTLNDRNAEYEALSKECQSLKIQLESVAADRDQVSSEVVRIGSEAAQQNLNIQNSIAEKQESINSVSAELESTKKTVYDLTQQIAANQQEMKFVAGQLEIKTISIEGLTLELTQKDTEIHDLTQSATKNTEQLKNVQTQLHEQAEYKMSLEEQLRGKELQFVSLQEQKQVELSAMNKRITELDNNTSQLKEMNQTLMGEDRNLASKLQEAEEKKLRQMEEVQYLTSQITELNTKLEEEIIKAQELEERIVKHAEKEVKMRGDVQILEEEGIKIFDLVQTKDQNLENCELLLQQRETTIEIMKNNEAQLLDTIDKFTRQVSTLSLQLSQAETTINNINEKLTSQVQKLATATSDGKDLSAKLSELEGIIAKLESSLEENSETIRALEEGATSQQSIIDQKEKEYRELLDQLTKLNIEKEEQANQSKFQIVELEKLLTDQFTIKEETLIAKMQQLASDNDKLSQEFECIKNERDGAALEGESAKFQINQLEEDLKTKADTIGQLEIDIASAQGQISLNNQQAFKDSDRISSLEQSELQSSRKVTELEETASRLQGANSGLANDLTEAQTAIIDLQKKIETDQKYITDLENLKQGAQSDSENTQQELMSELRKVQGILDDTNRSNQSLKIVNGLLQEQLTNKDVDIDSLRTEKGKVQESLKVSEQTIIELNDQIAELNADLTQAGANANRELGSLQEELLAANTTVKECQDYNEGLEGELQAANSTIEQFKVQATKSNDQISQRNLELEQENQQFKVEVDQLSNWKTDNSKKTEQLNSQIVEQGLKIEEKSLKIDQLNIQIQEFQLVKEDYASLEQKYALSLDAKQEVEALNKQLFSDKQVVLEQLKIAQESFLSQPSSELVEPITQTMSGIDPKTHEQLKEQMASIQESMHELQNFNFQVVNQNQEFQTQLSDANLDKEDMHQHIVMIESELSNITQEKESVNEDRNRLQKRIQQISAKLAQLESENAKLGESRRSLQNKLVQQSQNQSQGSSIEPKEDVIPMILKQREQEIEDLKAIITGLNGLEQREVALVEENERMSKDLERLEEDLFSFNSTDNEKTIRIDQLCRQNSSLKEVLEEIKRNIAESDQYVATQEEKIYELNDLVNQLEEQLGEMGNAVYISSFPMTRQEYEGKTNQSTYHSSSENKALANQEGDEKTILEAKLSEMSVSLMQKERIILDLQENVPVSEQKVVPQQTASEQGRIKNLEAELQDHKNRQIEQMATLLDLKLKIKQEQDQKVQLTRELTERRKTKDFSVPDKPADSTVTQVYENLLTLLDKRSKRQEVESVMQLLVGTRAALQDRVDRMTDQRGVIQQKARTISMEFQKLKSFILKGKLSHQEKSSLLAQVKPSESAVNSIVRLSETLADVQFVSHVLEN